MFDCIAALVKKVGNFFRDSFCFYGFLIAKFNPNSLPDLNKTPEDRPTLTVSAKLHHDNQENFCKNITIQEKTFGDGMFDHGAWLKFSECWKKSQVFPLIETKRKGKARLLIIRIRGVKRKGTR